MKALGSICLGWLLGGFVAANAAPVPAPTPAAAPPARIRVVANHDIPPYLFTGMDGTQQGYVVDVWRLFEAHTGIKVDLVATSWKDAQAALQSGTADVLDVVYRTPSREAIYAFSQPYSSVAVNIYTDRNLHGVRDVASLRGLSIGVEHGDACAEKLRSLGITDLVEYPDYHDVVEAAAKDRIRIFCMGESPASFFLYKYSVRDRVDPAFTLYTESLYRVVRKDNPAMLAVVNDGMALITSAELTAVRKRWLSAESGGGFRAYARAGGIVLAVILGVVGLLALWVWSLRRTVARRTRELHAGEVKLRAVFDASPDAMTVKDRDGLYVDCNEGALRQYGMTRNQLIGRTIEQVASDPAIEPVAALDEAVLRTGQTHTGVFTFPARAGGAGVRHYEILKAPLRGPDGALNGVLTLSRDVTERKHAETELRLAAAAFETQEAMVVTDAGAVIQRVNDAMVRLTGYTAAELVGQPTTMLRSRQHDGEFYAQVREHIRAHGVWQGELWLQGKEGEPRPVRLMVCRVNNADGEITHYVSSMIDLTSERVARASVDHMTFFDPLTDLPNRFFLHGRLQHALEGTTGAVGALLMIDLDHFKRINDLRGHAAGDRLLSLVAQRLRQLLDDRCVLCRFSGGTFALLEGCAKGDLDAVAEQARACATRVRQALHETFDLGDETRVMVTASIGWTCLVPGQGSPDSVLKEAELAMYSAKAAGRDEIRRFEAAMQADLLRREALVQDLRAAIAGDTLNFHLQAQIDRAGRITGAEMLLRWTRPCGETVSPSVFIPLAEESGLIVPLGDWVLDRACAQLAEWSGHPQLRELSLAVNVSAKQFIQPEFVEGVHRALYARGANPARLKLEITETAILGDLDEIAEKLARLRAQGVRVSLDDFGTGYSSLTYLSRLPLDQVKIDQSFVARLPADANDAMVAQTIIAMGRGLGMEVIAEGVETEAQHAFLMAQGCDAFQGYLISRPLPAAGFEAFVEARIVPA